MPLPEVILIIIQRYTTGGLEMETWNEKLVEFLLAISPAILLGALLAIAHLKVWWQARKSRN
jgi:hypothetical protein